MPHALRSLAKSPGFTLVIVFTLALGIGANTAIFSFFNGILLRPLPYDDAERVVMIKRGERSFADIMGEGVGLNAADFVDLHAQAKSLSGVTAYTSDVATLTGHGAPDLLFGAVVTADFFTVLGARAAHGRTFSAQDVTTGSGRLAVLQHTAWQNRFGGNPDILGQTVTLNGVSFTVVGIMPPAFEYPRWIQFWVMPAAIAPESTIGRPMFDQGGRGGPLRSIIGRLAPGVTLAQAENEIAALVARLPNPGNTDRRVHLMNLRDQSIGSVRSALTVLLACVGLVLLIACLNIANLMLSRATTRQREIAVRVALGANRWQIARHLLAESLVLALLGGAAGVVLSIWGVDLLVKLAPTDIPQLAAVHVDGRVLAFAFGVSLLTGLLSGLAPIIGAGRTDLAIAMKTGDRGGSAGSLPRRLRAVLVGGEVALSLILLVAAGLLLKSFWAMQAVSWGFEPNNVAVMRVAFAGPKYEDVNERRIVWRRLVHDLQAKPGFDAVATSFDKIGESWIHLPFTPDGFVPPSPQDTPQTSVHSVSPDYFRTLGITLLRGRTFTENDTDKTTPVVVIDAAIAERYFPNGDALGKRIRIPMGDRHAEIIGIVGRVKSDGPEATKLPDLYVPYLQTSTGYVYVFVRTSLDVATVGRTIQETVRAIDASLPTTELGTMAQVIERPAAARRFPMVLLAVFSALALLLATVGIYAVASYSVAQRTRELGVRLALGAQPRAVIALVLAQAFRPIAGGVVAGMVGGVSVAFAMRHLLFGIEPLHAPTFLLVPLLLGLVALIAVILPARRATRVDPLVALRAE
ncbi:MAG TPA: ABC transporter permease [Opitutus sp.]|nr:ABC transporter permease [Opitutus sp.]